MLIDLAQKVIAALRKSGDSIVFCESCTAGLAASTLGRFPGVSSVLTGSLVVYQTATKHDWLGLELAILNAPDIGPVSETVTRELAKQALIHSPTASIAAAVTGHLGPSSSIAEYDAARLKGVAGGESIDGDGTVYISVFKRGDLSGTCARYLLRSPTPKSCQTTKRASDGKSKQQH